MTLTVGIGQLGSISKKPNTNFYYFPVSAHILYLTPPPNQIKAKYRHCTQTMYKISYPLLFFLSI